MVTKDDAHLYPTRALGAILLFLFVAFAYAAAAVVVVKVAAP